MPLHNFAFTLHTIILWKLIIHFHHVFFVSLNGFIAKHLYITKILTRKWRQWIEVLQYIVLIFINTHVHAFADVGRLQSILLTPSKSAGLWNKVYCLRSKLNCWILSLKQCRLCHMFPDVGIIFQLLMTGINCFW